VSVTLQVSSFSDSSLVSCSEESRIRRTRKKDCFFFFLILIWIRIHLWHTLLATGVTAVNLLSVECAVNADVDVDDLCSRYCFQHLSQLLSRRIHRNRNWNRNSNSIFRHSRRKSTQRFGRNSFFGGRRATTSATP